MPSIHHDDKNSNGYPVGLVESEVIKEEHSIGKTNSQLSDPPNETPQADPSSIQQTASVADKSYRSGGRR